MAKALLGHVGISPDMRLVNEVTRLRRQVRDLEDEVARLRRDHERLSASVHVDDDILTLSRLEEPALT